MHAINVCVDVCLCVCIRPVVVYDLLRETSRWRGSNVTVCVYAAPATATRTAERQLDRTE